jgi:hypothetical protein
MDNPAVFYIDKSLNELEGKGPELLSYLEPLKSAFFEISI